MSSDKQRSGYAQSVTGLVESGALGLTLTHEHVLVDARDAYYVPHPDPPPGAEGPVSLDNLWWLIFNCFCSKENLLIDSVEDAVYELSLVDSAPDFATIHERTVVDVSCFGLRVDQHASRLREIAARTDTNIILGTGWYVKPSHPAELADMDEDAMIESMMREITEGVDGTDVRAGIIGEIGVSAPFDEVERRVVRASAQVQRMTGVPISVHPGMADEVLLDIVETLRDAGADLTKVILDHQDVFGYSREVRLEVAAAGCTLEFDTFGSTSEINTSVIGVPSLGVPSDMRRIEDLEFFIEAGFGSQIVISHDAFFKHRTAAYGGLGMSHILRNLVPVMQARGFSEDQLKAILVDNPARALTFGDPR